MGVITITPAAAAASGQRLWCCHNGTATARIHQFNSFDECTRVQQYSTIYTQLKQTTSEI